MKKTIIKTSLGIILAVLVLFLLLPFLETSESATADPHAKPQIFTSNPLTAIAQRLSALFGRKKKSQALPSLTEQQITEQFGKPLFAAAPQESSPEYIASAAAAPQLAATNAGTFSGDSGQEEWMLIEQTAPELNAPGMHEINIKENPYNRYMREQKNQQASNPAPAVVLPAREEEETSRWGKLVAPVKRFFGLSDSSPVQAAKLAGSASNQEAFQLASASQRNGSAYQPTNRRFTPDSFDLENGVPRPLGNAADSNTLAESQRLYNMLYPQDILKQTADLLAEARLPDAKQADQRKAVSQRELKRMEEELKNYIRGNMEDLQQNTEDTDNISEILGNCQISSLPKENSFCAEDDPSQLSAEEIAREQQKNEQIFYNITHLHLPHAPITPVLGRASSRPVAEQESEQEDQQGTTDTSEKSKKARKSIEIADWLYDQNQCDKNPCFWVANRIQVSPEISQSVENAGGKFVGDPLNLYSQNKNAYLAYVKEQTQNLDEQQQQQALQQAAKDFQEAAPAYIIYTDKNLQEAYQNLAGTLRTQQSNPNASFFYVTDKHDVLETAQAAGGYALLFSRQEMKDNPSEEGTLITTDTADNVKNVTEKATQLMDNAHNEVLRIKVNEGIDQFNKLLEINKANPSEAYNTVIEQAKQNYYKK